MIKNYFILIVINKFESLKNDFISQHHVYKVADITPHSSPTFHLNIHNIIYIIHIWINYIN